MEIRSRSVINKNYIYKFILCQLRVYYSLHILDYTNYLFKLALISYKPFLLIDLPMKQRNQDRNYCESFSQGSQEDLPFTHSPSGSMVRHEEKRQRPNRTSKVNYANLQDPNSDPEDQNMQDDYIEQNFDFLTPKIECLLWRRGQEEFLSKFINRSYLHVQWLTRDQLSSIGYQMTPSRLKSVATRMRKVAELKLRTDAYFNPNYMLPDRILTSTEVFTAIHHKRANDIKGKWQESMLLVCQKLLNFVKDGYPYGVIFHQPYDEQLLRAEGIIVKTNIGQILNKVYLGNYKNHGQFWCELGVAIRVYLKIYKSDRGDYNTIGLVIKECAAFLYQQWHGLSLQRYQRLRRFIVENNLIKLAKKEADQVIEEETPEDIFKQLSRRNILIDGKSVDLPNSEAQFELLNPGRFSFRWLEEDNYELKYPFCFLVEADMRNLDLNVEIDKLYFVKWRDLSYAEATWESQKNINAPHLIENFKLWNKIPARDTRDKMETHDKLQKQLIQYYRGVSDKMRLLPNQYISKMEKKLYLLDPSGRAKPKDYGSNDAPIYKNYRKLKDFQLDSLNWLIRSWHEGKNTILADEMGLGKTIQTIAFLYHLYNFEGVIGPFLILSPLTTLQQWRRQIEEWTSFNCLLYYDEGKAAVREIIQQYEFYHLHTTKSGDIIPSRMPKFQILLTNYELFINDFQILKNIPFQHMILDEAHRLKNKNTKTTTMLSQLPCVRKTLLTGTPIQNNTKELWTLLNFIEPSQFPEETSFMRDYGSLNTEEQVKGFKKMLKPYLLRRVKEDVESSIPQLSEMIIDVEMSSLQKTYYRGILQKNKVSILKSLSSANFNSISTQLRKCCNHPYLISEVTEAEIKAQARNAEQQLDIFERSSGKMILLLKLLEKFKGEGRKVLIFSQFVIMLDLMKPHLERRGYVCEILKGSQSSTIRNQSIERFNHQKTDIFLISTKAGGVGINLISATEIVIYDSDWNPQNDIQATARAHRIGQKKQVNVYRLITSDSYQSGMFQMSSKKMGLNMAVFSGATFKTMQGFDETEKQLSKNEIQLLLKKGIMGFLKNKVDQEQYFNQKIEDILSKNARKVEYTANKNSCVFSKTKFKCEETNDIHIDAPDFWERALKGVQTPVEKLLKKAVDLKQYVSVESQQQLIVETYQIVVNFVKQKTSSTNFNAEDQRNLLRLLLAITSQRHFDRHFRQIANGLSQQIEKPSRRFKIKEEDIRLKSKQSKQTVSLRSQQNRPRRGKLLQVQEEVHNDEYVNEGALDDEVSDMSQGERQQSQLYQKDQKGQKQEKHEQEEYKDQKVESQQKEQKSATKYDETAAVVDEDFYKLCYLCERLKCSIFCSGECGRSFHSRCYQLYLINDFSKPAISELQQLLQPLQVWRKGRKVQECINCLQQNYIFKCSICCQQGLYLKEEKTGKEKRKKKTNLPNKNEVNIDTNIVYRCSAPSKCNRFYHLSCLFTEDFNNTFADSMGRKVRSVQVPSKIFRCPAHYCCQCYGTQVKSTKSRSYCCIRCCKSYHDKCLPVDRFIRLGKDHLYICYQHLGEGDSTQQMIEEIKMMKPTKRDRVQQKMRAKEEQRKEKDKIAPRVFMEEKKVKTKEVEDSNLRRSKRIIKDQDMLQLVHEQGSAKTTKKVDNPKLKLQSLHGEFNLQIRAEFMTPKSSKFSISSRETSGHSNSSSNHLGIGSQYQRSFL